MVQRNVPNKLDIQADHVKSNKLLANLTKPSSPQHHDGMKSRGGPDLSKKMKKSRPIKRSSDMDISLRSSRPLRKEIAQPGEPPTLRVPTTAAASPHKQKQSPAKLPEASTTAVAPRKQSPGKGLEASPNYMKSTSSFDARKERPLVSSQISQASVVHKTPSPKNTEKTKHSPGFGHKASKTSSLTLVRTLTKTPSFKPSRASKKCSPVALCEDLDVQRATCSSTLKDSKFPHYLELNPGGTESEGTSAMKVCPYTYCSLNGHHHTPLPPLKCFLSARRRMLKTQKSFKLGCLSPRRTRPSENSMTEAGLVIFAEEPAIEEPNLEALSTIIPAPEGHKDFFIEIYTKDKEDGSATAGRSENLTDEKETVTEKADGKIVESTQQESPYGEIDFGHFNQNHDAISIALDSREFCPDYWKEEIAEETYHAPSSQEETASPPSNLLDQPDSEAFDMEWNAGECPESSICDVLILESVVPQDHNVQEQQIFNSDGTADNCKKEILDEEVLQGMYDEESVSSEAWMEDGDSDQDDSYHNMDIDDFIIPSDNLNWDQLSLVSDILEAPSMTEEDGSNKSDNRWDSMEDAVKAPKASSKDKNASEASNQTSVDLQIGDEMETDQVGATKSMVKIEPFDSSEGFTGADQNGNHEENKLPGLIKESETNQTFTDGGPSSQKQDDSSEKQSESNYAIAVPNSPEKGQEKANMFRPPKTNHSEDHENSRMLRCSTHENDEQAVDSIEVECTNMQDGGKRCSTAESESSTALKSLLPCVSSTSNEEMLKTCSHLVIIKSKRSDEDLGGSREFNPREPNYLPLELDPEAEKVDLKHQMIDERKNAEEWMVDFALRQAVTRLAPARKKKVALLVEAFEVVTPIPKYPTYLRRTSGAFAHTRPMQACS